MELITQPYGDKPEQG